MNSTVLLFRSPFMPSCDAISTDKDRRKKEGMPRVKPPKRKRKPIPWSCAFDNGVYEVYVDNVLVSSHDTKREALKEASRLRIPRPRYLHLAIRYKSICTWGDEVCKYWKRCYDEKGTTFTQSWGKTKVMLLGMKREARQAPPKPKKDRELDQFPHE